jgi:C1A family cysteine protease
MSAGENANAAGGSAGTSGALAEKAGGSAGNGSVREPKPQKKILNTILSQGKETDWKMADAVAHGIINQEFPESVDLREDWWEIADQGATGSCIGWASTDGMLRWHLVKANRINKTDRLSVRFIWMASKETDKFTDFPETFLERSGTPLKAAMDVMRKFGCVHEEVLPFENGFVAYEYDTASFFELAAQHKINGYYCLQYDETTNIDHFKQWISSVGPILAMIDIDSTFWKPYEDKKIILNEYDKASVDGGHAVTIVGYTKDYFIIRNSWGTEYGDNGYVYCSNEYMKAAFCEAYGIHV